MVKRAGRFTALPHKVGAVHPAPEAHLPKGLYGWSTLAHSIWIEPADPVVITTTIEAAVATAFQALFPTPDGTPNGFLQA